MIGDILAEAEVELQGKKYTVYLKEVASKTSRQTQKSFVRAFVREGEKHVQSKESMGAHVGGAVQTIEPRP